LCTIDKKLYEIYKELITKVNGDKYPLLIKKCFPELIRIFPKEIHVFIGGFRANQVHELWALFNFISFFAPKVRRGYHPRLSSRNRKTVLVEEEGELWIEKFAPCPHAGTPYEILQTLLPICTLELNNGKYLSFWYQCYLPQFYDVKKALGWTRGVASSKKLRIPDIMISEAKVEVEDVEAKEEIIELNSIEGIRALNIYTVKADTKELFAIIARTKRKDRRYYWIHWMNKKWLPDLVVECKESKCAYSGVRIEGWQDYLAMKARKAKLLVSTVHPPINIGDFKLILDELDKEKLQSKIKDIIGTLIDNIT